MPPKLKYQDTIDQLNLTDCPKNASEQDCEAFRFCYDTLEHPDTWVTQAEKQQRNGTFPRANASSEHICDSFGLSFFLTEQYAIAMWKAFPPKIKSRMGYTNLSKGQ